MDVVNAFSPKGRLATPFGHEVEVIEGIQCIPKTKVLGPMKDDLTHGVVDQ